jgi:poly [ADP-ribose] polymerase
MALINPADPTGAATPKVFEASINVVRSRSEFHRLRDLYRSTLNRSHACAGLELKRVYSVEIASMKKAFEARAASINNVMELWHGTNTANILSILHTGFKTQPPATAAITGKLFGPGLYFALQSTKSLNYGFGYWSGTKDRNCFLLLCDVAVGRYMVPAGGTSQRPPRGYDSYWARPGKSGVLNDEIVIFDAKQVNPRHLLEFGSK